MVILIFITQSLGFASQAVTGPRISLRALMTSLSLALHALLAQFFNLEVWMS
jgi:hypothetical protein